MNQTVKQKWVAALKSGSYKQQKYNLHSFGRFCANGVLCDLYAKEKNIQWQQSKEAHACYELEGHGISPPQFVKDWAQIDVSNVSTIQMLNDLEDWTLKEIAKFIEQKF